LAERWVAPALARFRQAHPGTAVELRIEAEPVDLQRSRAYIRFTYESHLYAQQEAVQLFRDVAYPFCTEAFREEHLAEGGIAAVPDRLLIHTDWGDHYASHPTWAGWFRATERARTPDVRQGLRVGGAAVALALAAQGAGIALVPQMLIPAVPEAARFCCPDPLGVPLPYAYYAIVSKDVLAAQGPRQGAVRALLKELQ
jgi:LysR family glycine cleavage system transcriptional activator